MRLRLLFLLCLSCSLNSFSQVQQIMPSTNQARLPGKTYALVIGIANYENKNIPNLNYSNKDAEEFAAYLKSKSGGLVPAENIRLLIDTNATMAAIYNSLNWLRDKCQADKEENENSDNLIYFYFSGHGDVESQTRKQLGFLLSYNTPGNNYINNAVRLEDLNYYASTLSGSFNARVVIITDACHSGKLAGSDHRGSFLIGKELIAAKSNEIRIASCSPEQLSQENEAWGGGRGIFSYYLVNGLKGLADRNRDSIITLNEIQQWLDSSISNDAVMKENSLQQTPVLKGNTDFKLAVVEKQELLLLQSSLQAAIPVQSNPDYFLSLLKNTERLELINYSKLIVLPKNEIALAFIKQLIELPDLMIDRNRLAELEKSLLEDKGKLESFNEQLAGALHTCGQQIINLYLQGDAAELEKRRYYNSAASGYDVYPAMYELAQKLTSPDNRLLKILKINQLYFSGVAARLKMPTVDELKQDRLLEEAIAAQKKALALEENAPYIQNELGILYKAKKDFVLAEKYFNNAIELAPAWAIPYANLSGIFSRKKEFEKALKSAQLAEELQPGLQLAAINTGIAYETSGNFLFAEEFYRHAIDINSRHYFPFERLGYVYMTTTNYAAADSFFHEADLRKKGYHFKANGNMGVPVVEDFAAVSPFFCNVDSSSLLKDDIMAFFAWGVQEYDIKKYSNAEKILKKVIALDHHNPLVFHYMGKIYYEQQKWEQAELMFKFAFDNYLGDSAFAAYCDSVITSAKYPYQHDCFETFFRSHYYVATEDHYFIASVYENWNHYDEAELHYQLLQRMTPDDLGPYLKNWQLLEKLGRFPEAELVIRSYGKDSRSSAISEQELNAFYRRIIDRFPENGDWYYRLGLMLSNRADLPSRAIYLDTIIWFPKLNKEVFIDLNNINGLGKELQWDRSIPGSPEIVILKNHVQPLISFNLRGTGETVTMAPLIYTPRKDAIYYLIKADSLLTEMETETKAAINLKIGDLFVRSGSNKQAWPYYNKSVELSPENAGLRIKLIHTGKAIYKNRAVLEQLNYLYDHQQINFPDRMLLAEFDIHAGEFITSKKILTEAQSIYPYALQATNELLGRHYLLSKQPALAINFYKQVSVNQAKGPLTLYTIARLYSQTGNKAEAWKWLENALNKGFSYQYVLNSDPAWIEFRETAKWTGLLKKYTMKQYPVLALN